MNPLAHDTSSPSPINDTHVRYSPSKSEMENMGRLFLQHYDNNSDNSSSSSSSSSQRNGIDKIMSRLGSIYLMTLRKWIGQGRSNAPRDDDDDQQEVGRRHNSTSLWNDPTVRIVMLLMVIYLRMAHLHRSRKIGKHRHRLRHQRGGVSVDSLMPALYAGLLVLVSNMEHRRPDMQLLWKLVKAQAYRRLFQSSLKLFAPTVTSSGKGEANKNTNFMNQMLTTVQRQIVTQALTAILRPLIANSDSASTITNIATKAAATTLSGIPAVATKAVRHLSMIEILISISIIVTFSGLAGIVYNRRFIDSKISLAKIEMNLLEQSILLFNAENHRYPVTLEEAMSDYGQRLSTRDPWGNDYIYVPHCNWAMIVQVLTAVGGGGSAPTQQQQQRLAALSMSSRDVQYWSRCLAELARILEHIPSDMVNIWDLLLLSDERAFIACTSANELIVSGQDSDSRATPAALVGGNAAQRERKIKRLAFLIKQARDKAVSTHNSIVFAATMSLTLTLLCC